MPNLNPKRYYEYIIAVDDELLDGEILHKSKIEEGDIVLGEVIGLDGYFQVLKDAISAFELMNKMYDLYDVGFVLHSKNIEKKQTNLYKNIHGFGFPEIDIFTVFDANSYEGIFSYDPFIEEGNWDLDDEDTVPLWKHDFKRSRRKKLDIEKREGSVSFNNMGEKGNKLDIEKREDSVSFNNMGEGFIKGNKFRRTQYDVIGYGVDLPDKSCVRNALLYRSKLKPENVIILDKCPKVIKKAELENFRACLVTEKNFAQWVKLIFNDISSSN